MRDSLNNRGGFDRVLMAVAATFLTVSATSALAQADQPRSSAAELAIDAAVPRPEPANVPPPTPSDFKADSTSSVSDAAKTGTAKTETDKTPDSAATKPTDVVAAPAADAGNTAKTDTAPTDTAKTDTTTT